MAAIAARDNLDLRPMPFDNAFPQTRWATRYPHWSSIRSRPFFLAASGEYVIRNCDRTRFQ
jgi:hypothetical protein